MKKDEIRAFGGDAQPKLAEGRTVTGYAVVFNTPSQVLYDKTSRRYFREVIKPEAVTPEFLSRQDIKLNRNHDDDLLLARSRYGEGTLKLEVDEYGLRYTAELPETTAGNDTLELIRRGDLFGSSFRFTYGQDGVKEVRNSGDRIVTREVTRFGGIYDVSVVADPAYLATSTSVRSLEEGEEPKEEEEEKKDEQRKMSPAELAEIEAELNDIEMFHL